MRRIDKNDLTNLTSDFNFSCSQMKWNGVKTLMVSKWSDDQIGGIDRIHGIDLQYNNKKQSVES